MEQVVCVNEIKLNERCMYFCTYKVVSENTVFLEIVAHIDLVIVVNRDWKRTTKYRMLLHSYTGLNV